MDISIIIPVFNSQIILPKLIENIIFYIKKDFTNAKYEIILVNDFSDDDSWESITYLCKKFKTIKGINLAKNYGQHNAIMAGLNFSKGSKIITIDDDFQHPPSALNIFLHQLDEFDACYTYYLNRKHNFWKKIASNLNNLISSFLLNKPLKIYMSSYRGFTRNIANEVIKYKKNNVYLDCLILKNTKKITMINVEHGNRHSGKSNYNLKKLLILWADMVLSSEIMPLRFNSFIVLFFKFLIKIAKIGNDNKEQYNIIGKTF